jgi:hypothetical protein
MRSGKSPSPTAAAPSRPTSPPAAGPARSGSAAPAATTSCTDVSYLPDLTAYLDDLLRTRERLAAAIDGVDDWARADATPAQEEITRIRRLIGRVQGDIAQRPATERAQVDQAVTVIRKHRAVNLGIPAIRPGAMPATGTSA